MTSKANDKHTLKAKKAKRSRSRRTITKKRAPNSLPKLSGSKTAAGVVSDERGAPTDQAGAAVAAAQAREFTAEALDRLRGSGLTPLVYPVLDVVRFARRDGRRLN